MKFKFKSVLLTAALAASSIIVVAQQAPSATPPTFPSDPQTSPSITPDKPAPPDLSSDRGGQDQSSLTASEGRQNSLGAGTSTANSDIVNQVQKALAGDSMLEKSSVSVDVKDGQLILTGTVSSEQAKERAEQIASEFAADHNLKLVNNITVQS